MADQLNPSWRKVLISGSNAHVHEITASGISAAVSNPTLQKVLVYDTNSGAFYYTGSYGGSGGGGTADDITTTTTVATTAKRILLGDNSSPTDVYLSPNINFTPNPGNLTIAGDLSATWISASSGIQHTDDSGTTIALASDTINIRANTNSLGKFSTSGVDLNLAGLNINTTVSGNLAIYPYNGATPAITNVSAAIADAAAAGNDPGGSDTYIQYNDGGTFAGISNFTFNKNTDTPIVTIQGGGGGGDTATLFITASNAAQAVLHLKSLRPQIWFEDYDGFPDFYLLQKGGNLVMGTTDAADGPITFNPNNGNINTEGDISGSGTGSFGELEGIIDTSGAQANYRLIFNGSKFVAVPEDTSFEFAINSFNYAGPTSNILIGNSSHVVFSAGVLDFTADYNAGPPDFASASIKNDTFPDPVIFSFSMDSPNFTTGDNPSNITMGDLAVTINERIDFQLTASKNGDTLYSLEDQNIYFYNHMKFGASTVQSGHTSTNISNLSNQVLASSYFGTTTRTVSVGASNYLNIAVRTAATQPSQVYCGTGDNQLTVAMNPTVTNKTPSVRTTVTPYTNDNGYAEAFYVYSSENTNLSSHSTSFQFATSAQVKNYIFWGRDTNTGQETEAGVEALENKNSSYDDGTITGQTLTVGTLSSEYIYIAIPSRYGVNDTDYQIKDNSTGLPLDVNSAVDVDITNPVGFQEEYKVYRSTNQLTKATTFTALIDTL